MFGKFGIMKIGIEIGEMKNYHRIVRKKDANRNKKNWVKRKGGKWTLKNLKDSRLRILFCCIFSWTLND